MPDLAAFQRDFAAALLADLPSGEFARHGGFAVYRNTSARGSVEALRAAFPTIDLLIGDEMFNRVALDYRSARPPASPVLSDYGNGFAAYLAAQPWTCELPYLADVAKLDWLWLGSFTAPDAEAAPRLAGSTGTRRLALHPAARFAWLTTPAMTIWQAHRDPAGVAELTPDWRDEGALFTRPGEAVRAELIGPELHCLLCACTACPDPDDCLAAVGRAFPEADLTRLLEHGFRSGALIIF